MLRDPHDFSPEELLEKQLTEAYLEQDIAGVQEILRRPDTPNALKERMLTTALHDGNLAIVRCAFEEAKVELTPERGILLVFLACRSGNLDVVLYLSEKTAQLGLQRSDAYELVFSRFPAGAHAKAAEELLTRAQDKQDALNKMFYAAAKSQAFDVLPKLLDMGADPNPNGGTDIYLLLSRCPRPFFEKKDDYVALIAKYLDRFEDRGVLDTALIVAAFKIPDDTQYAETIQLLLDKGADPFGDHGKARRHIVAMLHTLGRSKEAAAWEMRFQQAQQRETAESRRQFDILFKEDFRTQDLRHEINADGDTGFTLAARARILDRVLAAACREGNAAVTADDILRENHRHQSAVSLALDRDELPVLLNPGYWPVADAGILRAVEKSLTDEQKQHAGLERLFAAHDQFALKRQANKFKVRL